VAVDNILKFRKGKGTSLVDDLEALMTAAKNGDIVALCGYAVFPNGDVVCLNTNHGIVDNGCVAYCSVLLARQVGDSSDE
jgi:hypothetical protein